MAKSNPISNELKEFLTIFEPGFDDEATIQKLKDEAPIDLILSSYNATLSPDDQKLLQLLDRLELSGLDLYKYHPFIWGNNGAIFYEAKRTQKLSFLKTPNIDELFKGFNNECLRNSISCFPINVTMNETIDVYAENVEPHERYDPRFILPLFYHFLSVQLIVKYHKFIYHGCLGYVIASLSSFCPILRSIAYRVLANLYRHLENANYPEDRELWIGMIDYIRSGLTEPNQRIGSVHTVLLARIVEVLLDPTHMLFPAVRSFMVRQQLNPLNYKSVPLAIYRMCLKDAPGTNQKEFAANQRFVIGWIADSLRTDADVKMWQRCYALSDLLTYYNSPLLAPENRPLIMKLLIRLATLYEGVKVLCYKCAIFSWINHQLTVVPHLSSAAATPKDSLYRLVVEMWNTAYREYSPENPHIMYEAFGFELILVLSKIVYKVTDVSRVETYRRIFKRILKHTENETQRKTLLMLMSFNPPVMLKRSMLEDEHLEDQQHPTTMSVDD